MEILCFGDSHARYFKKSNMLGWGGTLGPSTPKIIAYDYVAASAKGFAAGERSRFAYKKFMRDLATHDAANVCLAYGQVDAEVGFYYRKYVAGTAGSAEADLSSVYRDYVAMAKTTLPDARIVFKGPNPSTMRMDTQLTRYVFMRLTARVPQQAERDRIWDTILSDPPTVHDHARLNCLASDLLAQAVRAAGYHVFDIRNEIQDPDHPGLARWDFVPAESDVHLTDSLVVRRACQTALFCALEG